jgi:hypothetical protein
MVTGPESSLDGDEKINSIHNKNHESISSTVDGSLTVTGLFSFDIFYSSLQDESLSDFSKKLRKFYFNLKK